MYKISVIFYITFILYLLQILTYFLIFLLMFCYRLFAFLTFWTPSILYEGLSVLRTQTIDLVFKILSNDLPKNLTYFLNFSLQKLQSPDALGVTITRCVAVMYLYFQFRDLKKMGSRYLLGKHSLFVCNLQKKS